MKIKNKYNHPGRHIFIFSIILSLACAQTAYYGLESGFHISGLALAGGGVVISSAENDRQNPALLDHSQPAVGFSWLEYPAGISGGIASFQLSWKNHPVQIGLRQLNYGEFDGYDNEAQSTGSYGAADTWLTISTAGTTPRGFMKYGLTAGAFTSQLEDYIAQIFTFTAGVSIDSKKHRLKIGAVIRNLGLVRKNYTEIREDLPTQVVVGVARSLAHLPLELALDIGYYTPSKSSLAVVNGIINLAPGLKLRWGTSTAKIDQAPGYQDYRDLLAASGAAVSFTFRKISIDAGGYFYGPGAYISGMGLEIAL